MAEYMNYKEGGVMSKSRKRSYFPYAEEMSKTVNLNACKQCDGLSFAHENDDVMIPFCKYIWFGGKCKRKKVE